MKKKLQGKVVSIKMQDSAVVAVELPKMHPVYKRLVKNTRRFKVNNELKAQVGDVVKIVECRPYSKHISWKIAELVEENGGTK